MVTLGSTICLMGIEYIILTGWEIRHAVSSEGGCPVEGPWACSDSLPRWIPSIVLISPPGVDLRRKSGFINVNSVFNVSSLVLFHSPSTKPHLQA